MSFLLHHQKQMKALFTIFHIFTFLFSFSQSAQSDQIRKADKLWYNAADLQEKRQYRESLLLFRKALRIYTKELGGKHEWVGDTYLPIADHFTYIKEPDSATIYYKNAIDIYSDILPEHNSKLLSAYNNMSIAYAEANEYEDALRIQKNVLRIKKKNAPKLTLSLATSYANIGDTYLYMGRYEEAINNMKIALSIRRDSLGFGHPSVAKIYNNLSVLYKEFGALDKAEKYALLAHEIYSEDKINNDGELSDVYVNLGNICELKTDFERAMAYQKKALIIRSKIYGSDHVHVAVCLENIANIYSLKGEKELALEENLKSYKIFGQSSNSINYAKSCENLGNRYSALGEYKKALDLYKQSEDIFSSVHNIGHVDIVIILLNLAECEVDIENYKSAQNYLRRAENNLKLNMNRSLWVDLKLISCRLLEKKSEPEKVINEFSQLIDNLIISYEKSTSLLTEEELNAIMKTFSSRATFFYNLTADSIKFLCHAEEDLNRCIGALNILQSRYDYGRSRYDLAKKYFFVFEMLLKVYNESKEYKEMFDACEESKLLLQQKSFDLTTKLLESIVNDSLLHDYKLVLFQLNKKEKVLYSFERQDTALIERLEAQIFDLREKLLDKKGRMEIAHPQLFNILNPPEPVKMEKIKAALVGDRTLLEYFVGDSSVFVFVVRSDTFHIEEIKKDFALEEWVSDIQRSILSEETTSGNIDSLSRLFVERSRSIYQKIVAPVEDLLTEEVIIVPDGVLGYLPFDVLVTNDATDISDAKYFIHDHQIAYQYSATLWLEMKKKKVSPKKQVLAYAPDFPARPIDTTYSDLYAMRSDLWRLRFSKDEVNAIDNTWSVDKTFGEDATVQNFIRDASDYRIVHLSTHGKADDRVGDYCYLAFTEISDTLDRKLYVRDLYNMKLNADMVVLSACETGLGELQQGEGILSLARGFAYAGAKSIVSTLWSVDDKSTSDIMASFYKHLKDGKTKDASLRQAKLDYLFENPNAHPFYWAAFTAVGDMSPIERQKNWWYWLVGLGITLAGAYVFRNRME